MEKIKQCSYITLPGEYSAMNLARKLLGSRLKENRINDILCSVGLAYRINKDRISPTYKGRQYAIIITKTTFTEDGYQVDDVSIIWKESVLEIINYNLNINKF